VALQANTVHFAVAMENATIVFRPTVSHILAKNKAFPLKQSLTCAKFGIYVATCVIRNKQHVGKPQTNFPRDGQCT